MNTSDEAFVGWRVWRILPWTGPGEYRLCAAGTRGVPKVWEPREPKVAVCSDFSTTHDAPAVDHDCGVYAFRERSGAEEILHRFASTNADGVVGWAIGRVSLWGRVIECDLGWRAQKAYPYALTVHAEPVVAAGIRRLYAVEAEPAEPIACPPAEPTKRKTEVTRLRADIASLVAEIRELERLVKPPQRTYVPDYLCSHTITDDELLAAVRNALDHDRQGAAVFTHSVAKELADLKGARLVPNSEASMVGTVGLLLKRAWWRGLVVQLRHGTRGSSLWTLPDVDLPENLRKCVVQDDSAERDAQVCDALGRALEATNAKAVRIREVMAQLGEPPNDPSLKGRVAQALLRCVERGRVQHRGPLWSLAA
jgi:hypothetical protein